MRLIDVDALIMALRLEYPMMPMFKENQKEWGIKTEGYRKAEEIIKNAPSIDVVRCQDCKHWVYNFNGCARNPCTEPWYATDFCNYGEREGE